MAFGLKIGNDIDGERFGFISLSANGSVLAIGLPNSSVNATNSGQVQIYELNTSNVWTKKDKTLTDLVYHFQQTKM